MIVTIILIFLLSFFLRWINLQDYLFFGFEQGRDALIAEGILKHFDFVLVGPATNVEGVFHGAWYYYLLLVPYGLSGGNPLAASFFLVVLGALVPVAVFFLSREIFKSKTWALIASLLTVFSYEYILYSRWLSNVSPAPLFIVLCLFALWKFIKTGSGKFFILFAAFASIASLFELILLPEFLFLLVLLTIFRLIRKISLRSLFFSFLTALFFFAPTIIFDFRNEHIIFKSISGIAKESSAGGLQGIANAFEIYTKQLYIHLFLSLFYIKVFYIQLFTVLVMTAGLITAFIKNKDKNEGLFILSLILMSLPVMKISPGDPQHYVGIGLGFILIFCYSLKVLYGTVYFRYLAVIFSVFFLLGLFNTVNNLLTNKDVFFRTTQDDLVYSDQLNILKFINEDSNGRPYKFINFTVPFLHPEGWEYLHKYYYPDSRQDGAEIIYITIEEGVYPVWEEKWINDLGRTRLEMERKFGLIRLQKRIPE